MLPISASSGRSSGGGSTVSVLTGYEESLMLHLPLTVRFKTTRCLPTCNGEIGLGGEYDPVVVRVRAQRLANVAYQGLSNVVL